MEVGKVSCLPGVGDGNHHERAKLQRLSQRGRIRVARLTAFALSEDPEERAVAAGHPMTPVEMLEHLSVDPVYNVRSWVVRNTATPVRLLNWMKRDDSDPRIRAAAKAEWEWRVERD